MATVFFGESTSMLQLTELARDAELEQRRKAADAKALLDAAQAVGMAARAVRLGFDAGAGKLLRSDALARREFLDALDRLIESRPARWLMKSRRSVTAAKSCPHCTSVQPQRQIAFRPGATIRAAT